MPVCWDSGKFPGRPASTFPALGSRPDRPSCTSSREPHRDTDGRRHLCFFVTDLKGAMEAMRSAGFPITDDGRGTIPGIERFYIMDPDGNRIEIQAKQQ